MKPLQVGVNLTWMTPHRVGGSEEYMVRQLSGIADGIVGCHNADNDIPDLRLRLYVHPGFVAAHPDLATRIDVAKMPTSRDNRALRIGVEHTWLACQTRRDDIVHHGGGTMPVISKPATLLTVHDLQYRRFPHYFSALRRRYLDTIMPRSVRAATVVAVPSNYVRSTVIDAFGADPQRVVVIRHGVPELVRPDPTAIAAVKAEHGVVGPYLAYAAITHRHKGHRQLVELLARTASAGHPLHEHRLVLMGGQGAAENDLTEAIVASGVAPRVIRTGRVSASDRDALLAGADALVFPSEYEGFGAPLVEAMALGVPIVASDHPAVVEVIGEAGVIVGDDGWEDAITEAIERRHELVAAGERRREHFTVVDSGRELATAYRLAAQLADR